MSIFGGEDQINPFTYGGGAGYYSDGAAGMALATFRWYSPQLSRWASRDPIRFVGGDNLYRYVNSQPVNLRDPLGLADSVTDAVQQALARGDVEELETLLDAAGDEMSPSLRDAVTKAIERLRSSAQDIISKECQGSINREFPGQLRDKTLQEIMDLAKDGDAPARKALKLLKALRFRK